MQSIFDTQEIKPENSLGLELKEMENSENIIRKKQLLTPQFLKTKQYSLIVDAEEDGQMLKRQSPQIHKLLITSQDKEQKSESHNKSHEAFQKKQKSKQQENDFTKDQLEQYDKMMYQWRKVQRESLSNPTIQTKNYGSKKNKKPISEEKDQIFQKYLPEIQCYLRAKFIYEELLEPIHTDKMVDLNDLSSLEFIYLISFRAWCEINKAKQMFAQKSKSEQIEIGEKSEKQTKTRFTKYEINIDERNQNSVYLMEPILKQSDKIETLFNHYHKALTLKEKSFVNRLRTLKNYLFNYKAKTEHDKFLCGFQGIDFTASEQVLYTSKYLEPLIKSIKQKNSEMKNKKIIPKIANYKEIVTTQFQRLQGFDDFDIRKVTIIKEWMAKNKMEESNY